MEQKYLEVIQKIKKEHTKDNGYIDKRDKYHKEMDNVLLDMIKELGFSQIVDEYIKAKENFYYI